VGRTPRARVVLAGLLIAVAACSPTPDPVAMSGEHEGLVVEGQVTDSGSSIVVDVVVRNQRDDIVHLETDQCGRVTDVELERNVYRPEGRHWGGSIQAVKELVLNGQRFDDDADWFAPRRVRDRSSDVPDCLRPDHAIPLEPGVSIAERWELPFEDSRTLKEVGSDAAVVSIEAIEARDPTAMEYFDIVYFLDEDADRAGRVARAELPLSSVLGRAPTEPLAGPTEGELFDRLLDEEELRSWIEAQPADSWGRADLRPAYPGYGADLERLRLEMVTTAFERAAVVTAEPDGSDPTIELPDERSRTREFPRTAGTLPPGIEALPDSAYLVSDDLHVGEVLLPSGRVIVGEFIFDAEPLDVRVAPGGYPVHATLVRHPDAMDDERVAFASLVLSDAPTVRWQETGAIAVDGGTATITSIEGRDEMNRIMDDDPLAAMDVDEQIFDSMVAHDYLATEWALTPETNLVRVSTGVGDGGYPVYVGFDGAGNPTRVVMDFLLLHLVWTAP
jgi:hypothetical protein